jgi:hypothetical protein
MEEQRRRELERQISADAEYKIERRKIREA